MKIKIFNFLKILLFFVILSILSSFSIAADWSKISTDVTLGTFIGETSNNNLFLYKGYDIYRSIDDGVTWNKVYTLTGWLITAGAISSDDVIYVTNYVSAAQPVKFFRSTDYGVTWENINTPTSGRIYDIIVGRDNTVYAGGTCRGIWRSFDRGNTWEEILTPYSYCEAQQNTFSLYQPSWVLDDHIYASLSLDCGDPGGGVISLREYFGSGNTFSNPDNTSSWKKISVPDPYREYCGPSKRGFINVGPINYACYYGPCVAPQNTYQFTGPHKSITESGDELYMIATSWKYPSYYREIIKSSDQGVNWQVLNDVSQPNFNPNDLAYYDNSLYVAGNINSQAKVYQYDGQTFTDFSSGIVPTTTDISSILVASSGIFISTNEGIYSISICVPEICDDSLDNDCDGSIDCADSDCSPDLYSNCCLSAADQTSGVWTWDPSVHEDAGVGWSSNTDVYNTLFNSNNAPCPEASGGSCFDSNGDPINHKSALTSGNCCGNDANEFYKPDYYGGECTSDVNDCAWSTGDSQSSDTGNEKWWCFEHEWFECDGTSETIGTTAGGVTCAGTLGNAKWTPNSLVLSEDQYSCTDELDNDGDGFVDCQDSDCNGKITGYVKNEDNEPLDMAKIEALQGLTKIKEAYAQPLGDYEMNIACGAYDLVASKTNYVSGTKTNINLPPKTTIQQNFTLDYGRVCEEDCTYLLDDRCHKECNGVNGCEFYDDIAAEKCDLAKVGWEVEYNETHFVECPSGSPQETLRVKAVPSCPYGNLIKYYRIVSYKGKMIRMVTVVCGD